MENSKQIAGDNLIKAVTVRALNKTDSITYQKI